ncbi:MAG: glycosyltransferase family 9 protein [Nitrospira sp.]|jgi:ADP-heptose:LPS heptosyltransferase
MFMRNLKSLVLMTAARIGHALARPSTPITKLEAPNRILVFQAGGIGDILRTFPVLESLHAAFPDAELFTLSPFNTSVYELLPEPEILTGKLSYNPTSDHRSFMTKIALTQTVRRQTFDLIVNPARGQGMLQHALLSFAFGAPIRIGFNDAGAGFANTIRIPLAKDKPIVRQNLDLLRAIGIEPQVPNIHLRVRPIDLTPPLPQPLDKLGPLIAIHPGSTWDSCLQWPLTRYTELLSALLREYRGTILLLGTGPEASMGEALLTHSKSPRLVNLIGKTSLTQVVAILSRCVLFIGNDSGLLHVALGLRTPAIGLFGYTAPCQVIDPEGPCIALHKPGEAPLYEHQAFFNFDERRPNPLNNIQVEDVLEAARSLLQDTTSSSPSTDK